MLAALLLAQAISAVPVTSAPGPSQGSQPSPASVSPTSDITMTVLSVTYPGELDAYNYSDVLVLINNNSQMSKDIGEYFARARGIPTEQVAYLDVPAATWIDRDQYEVVKSAVKRYMIDHQLVNRINYLVTTKGFPMTVYNSTSGFMYGSCVDEELALIFGSLESQTGNYFAVENPYYGARGYFKHGDYPMYIVNRLTGYNWSDIKDLIDRANSTYGNRGLFVLDTQPWKGFEPSGYGIGNVWLRDANDILTERAQHVNGIDILYEDTPWYSVGQQDVIGYASWGSNDGNASDYAKPHNTWVNGSIAETYVSTSGRSFDWPPSYGQSLIADILREGATGAKGYVQEPFLSAIAHPDILFERYTSGFNLAESYRMASVMLGWMGVVVGDPKASAFRDVPDASLSDAQVSCSNLTPATDDPLTVYASLDNRGGPVENLSLELYVDQTAVWSGNVSLPRFSRTRLALGLDAPAGPGPHDIALRVNPMGDVFETTFANNAGTAQIECLERPTITLAIDPSSVLTQESFRATINVSRAPRGVKTFLFDFGDGSPVVETTSTETMHAYEEDGEHTVTARVIDPAMVMSLPAQAQVSVLNRLPVASISVDPTSARSGESMDFSSAKSSDPDGEVVAVAWDLGDGNTSSEPSLAHAYARPGEYVVRLTVTDDDGGTARAERRVTVINRPPVAAFAVDTPEVWRGRPATFNASASADPDGTVSSYEWDFGDGSRNEVSRSPWMVHTFARAGTFTVRLVVLDDLSEAGASTMSVAVGNRAPVANISAHPVEALTGVGIDLDASASLDPDGAIVRYVFTAGLEGGGDPSELYAGEAPTLLWTPLDDGQWVVTVSVEDDDGAFASVSTTVVVVDRPPVLGLEDETSMLQGTVLRAPATVYLVTAVSDPDGRIVNVTWYLDGVAVAQGTATSLIVTAAGPHTVQVVAVDDDGSTAEATVSFRVNSAPIASLVATLKGLPVGVQDVDAGAEVFFTAENSTDPEGGELSYAWDMGDGTLLVGRTVTHAFAVEGAFTVRLTVTDEHGASSTATQTLVVVEETEGHGGLSLALVAVVTVVVAAVVAVTILTIKRRSDGTGDA